MLLRALNYRDKGMETLLAAPATAVAMAFSTCWITDHAADQETEIINKLGLHARASAKLTQTCRQVQVRGLDGQGARAASTPKHHGRDDAGRRQGFKRSPRLMAPTRPKHGRPAGADRRLFRRRDK